MPLFTITFTASRLETKNHQITKGINCNCSNANESVTRLLKSTDLEILVGIRDQLEGISNIIWSMLLRFEPQVSASHAPQWTAHLESDAASHEPWADICSMASFLCPAEAFTGGISIDLFKRRCSKQVRFWIWATERYTLTLS